MRRCKIIVLARDLFNVFIYEEHVGEMHMKDYIDVSNQENVAPVYFQSLSLD